MGTTTGGKMEIVKRDGEYRIKYDGREWQIGELENHIANNGHLGEPVSFVANDMSDWRERYEIAERIKSIPVERYARARNSK